MRDQRAERRAEFGTFYDRVSEILFEADPVGINFGHNTDEYEPEVDTILPRLRGCSSVEDVHRVIYEEFLTWFGPGITGSKEKYLSPAERVWAAWAERERE